MTAEITDKDIREHLEAKLKKLQDELDRVKIALKAYSEQNGHIETPPNATLLMKITATLKEADEPLTSRELMDIFNKKYPEKTYKLSAFSGRLSQLHDKINKKSEITIFEVPNTPLSMRYFYILKSWYKENGELKQEYLQKLEKRGII